jgi:DNA topoisomerase-3
MMDSAFKMVGVVCKLMSFGELGTVDVEQVIKDSKVTDHHAIIPTAELGKADISSLPDMERNILRLICTRFACAVKKKHTYETVTATFECGGYEFITKGRAVIDNGWKAIEQKFLSALKLKDIDSKGADADSDVEENAKLPPIAEGQVFSNTAASVTEQFTKPPKQYTEDTLLSAMENAGKDETANDAERTGLGTPATRAAIIEKLVSCGFITRKGRQLVPTADGISLIRIIPPALKSPMLTSEWENALARIAKGEIKPDLFMRGIEKMVRGLIAQNTAPIEEYKEFFKKSKESKLGKGARHG